MEKLYTCTVCGLICTENNPEKQYGYRELVFCDLEHKVCSNCSIDYAQDELGNVVLRAEAYPFYDRIDRFLIMWADLTPEAQQKLTEFCGGGNVSKILPLAFV